MTGELGFDSEQGSEIFSSPVCPEHSRDHPAIYAVYAGSSATGLGGLGYDAICSPRSSTEVEDWNCTSTGRPRLMVGSSASAVPPLQGGAQDDPVFDLLIKSLFQLQYWKLTYKKKDHCMEIYPLWIKRSTWPTLCLATSLTWTVMSITRLHISSVILLQTWMINALNSIIVCGFFGKIFTLRNPRRM
jgi:hypothetical protein